MARTNYEYETSPRKLEPDYDLLRKKLPTEREKEQKRQQEEAIRLRQERIQKLNFEKKRRIKLTIEIVIVFAVLVGISYRNSVINERFSEIQDLKNNLAVINKENEQTEVAIKSSLNLTNIEKTASSKLGMQKRTNKQTIYVELPKEDYVEKATEEIQLEENTSWLQKLKNFIKNI